MSVDAPGPAALRALRHDAGLSQEALAERARLGVRTIRDLESGRVRVPQQASLTALTEALGLDPDRADAFLRNWTDARWIKTFTELADTSADVDALLSRHADDYVDLSVSEVATVDAARRVSSVDCRVAMRAQRDGVEHRMVLWGRTGRHTLTEVRLDGLRGCEVSGSSVLAEHDLAVFELSLGRVLAAGETHAFGYRIDTRDALRDGEPDTDYLHGFRRRLDSYVLEVDFSACGPPTRLWQTAGTTLHRRAAGDVEVSAYGTAHRAYGQLEPGLYGLEWEW